MRHILHACVYVVVRMRVVITRMRVNAKLHVCVVHPISGHEIWGADVR